jgi:hypothetical protein
VFYFLLYPIGQSYAILKTKLEEQIMKIAMRLLVATALVSSAFGMQSISFAGGGGPIPLPKPNAPSFAGGGGPIPLPKPNTPNFAGGGGPIPLPTGPNQF